MAARDAVKRVPEITRNHCPNSAKCARAPRRRDPNVKELIKQRVMQDRFAGVAGPGFHLLKRAQSRVVRA